MNHMIISNTVINDSVATCLLIPALWLVNSSKCWAVIGWDFMATSDQDSGHKHNLIHRKLSENKLWFDIKCVDSDKDATFMTHYNVVYFQCLFLSRWCLVRKMIPWQLWVRDIPHTSHIHYIAHWLYSMNFYAFAEMADSLDVQIL